MTIKITPVIMMALVLIAIAPNARAEIASKAYVDDQNNTIIFGTTEPDEADVERLADHGGVFEYIRSTAETATEAYEKADSVPNRAVGLNQTGKSGLFIAKNAGVRGASGGVIDDSLVSSSAAIQLGKLGFPTPGAECATRGCMLMFYNGQYVWEVVTRDTNETIATTGAVSATPTTGTTVTEVTAASANF